MDSTVLANILKRDHTLTQSDLAKLWCMGDGSLREVLALKGNIDETIQLKILKSNNATLQKNLICNKFVKENILLDLLKINNKEFVNYLLNNNSSCITRKVALAIIESNTQVFPLLYRSNLPKKVYKICLETMTEELILDSYPSAKQFSEKILKNDSDLALTFLNNKAPKNMWGVLAALLIPYKKFNLYESIVKILQENPEMFTDSGFAGGKRKLIHDSYSLEILYFLQKSNIFGEADFRELNSKIQIFETALEDSIQGSKAVFKQANIIHRFYPQKAVKMCVDVLDKNYDNRYELLDELSNVSYEIFKKIFVTRNLDDKAYMISIKPALEVVITLDEIEKLVDSGELSLVTLSKLNYFKANKKLVINYTRPLKNYLHEEYVITALSSVLTSNNMQTILTMAPIWEGTIKDLVEVAKKI